MSHDRYTLILFATLCATVVTLIAIGTCAIPADAGTVTRIAVTQLESDRWELKAWGQSLRCVTWDVNGLPLGRSPENQYVPPFVREWQAPEPGRYLLRATDCRPPQSSYAEVELVAAGVVVPHPDPPPEPDPEPEPQPEPDPEPTACPCVVVEPDKGSPWFLFDIEPGEQPSAWVDCRGAAVLWPANEGDPTDAD